MFLDTTFCIDLMREHHRGIQGPATSKLIALDESPLYASLFVACELHAGARLASDPRKELRKVQWLMEHVELVLPDDSFAVAYGEAEADLRKAGKPIPQMDLLIGVTAKVHGRALLTRDPGHYRHIRGLVVETY